MFERYQAKIEEYCNSAGFQIPVGFGRHDAERYVAIDLDSEPPKLVAATWADELDVVNYLVKHAAGRKTQVLDFKDRRELTFNGKSGLLKGEAF
ncbi:hypothetical protein QTH87_23785 [Variovorax sp. J22P168]|uniref:hypothetical protein n=1 Tax=Variovorax jilinensis TaxID=3053513 RepID=UPI002577BDC6|nr:hypothetical protein [Variovorax sp. J22P168]MDM0015485.1 hypothetical protein [Variovorax sp. J22P168]